jgi:hypothetical protein
MVALLALVQKVVDFTKFISAKQWASAVTQIYVWTAGVVVVVLFAQTEWADTISFNGLVLADMNFATLLVIGLGIASTASAVRDVTKAIDNGDTAATPPLI